VTDEHPLPDSPFPEEPPEAASRREPPRDFEPPSSRPPASSGNGATTALTDGDWHRLHPASPLLKGGIALIAILGVVVANMRERIFDLFLPHLPQEGDPVDYILDHGLIGWALIAIAVLLILLIAGFYASWRMHTFRITDEVVEVRSGILFRTNRKARLDRIQGINIVRPFFARLFGAAKLEISQAGQGANVQLSYLGSAAADGLRREILRLASGARGEQVPAPQTVVGESIIDRRVNEFLAPELDPDAAPPESIVKLDLGRLIGSLALSGSTIMLLVLVAAGVVWIAVTGDIFALFWAVPGAIGFGSYYVRKFTKSLRYSIAGTPDGVRVGFGLLSTSNETLPPGRIHSVQVSQPLLWRLPGWWEIKVNRAGHSSTKGAGGEANTTILPVGDRGDVHKVLELMLPELLAQSAGERAEDAGAAAAAVETAGVATISAETSRAMSVIESGLEAKGGPDDGFTNSPRRAAVLRWFSWRRNGFAITQGSLVLRKGAIWRQLVIVPQPRLQSVSLHQGPLLRMLRLASVHLHTVAGPISADLGAIDRDAAIRFFEEVATVAVSAAVRDTTHRWRENVPLVE
jgi:putative membrane protein